MASARTRTTAEGWGMGARYVTRHNTNCIKRGKVKRAQGCCPWSPSQEGARDQSASARRGLPSKGEARALHHHRSVCCGPAAEPNFGDSSMMSSPKNLARRSCQLLEVRLSQVWLWAWATMLQTPAVSETGPQWSCTWLQMEVRQPRAPKCTLSPLRLPNSAPQSSRPTWPSWPGGFNRRRPSRTRHDFLHDFFWFRGPPRQVHGSRCAI